MGDPSGGGPATEPQVEELRERARAAARAEVADPSMGGYRSRYWQEWAERVADAVLDVLNPRQAECRFCGGERAVMAGEPCADGGPHYFLWDLSTPEEAK